MNELHDLAEQIRDTLKQQEVHLHQLHDTSRTAVANDSNLD